MYFIINPHNENGSRQIEGENHESTDGYATGKSKKQIIGLCHGYDFTKEIRKRIKVALNRPDRIEMLRTMVANAT